ncbi:hypothetical protein AU252_20275 [Pseudarthrobacter sulfonivorans]|uniref:Uncharacterized protein n=1 Tax=Pseudarthrobacter sulfonivorans TaxID=121292 RepID=A0A0U3FVY8_9MICC|nr:hypothetical protein AU252_20275 [Pseudarthrobacter sulfonivorans]
MQQGRNFRRTGFGYAQAAEGPQSFSCKTEPLLACRQNGYIRTGPKQPIDEGRDVIDQVFATIQYQERLFPL